MDVPTTTLDRDQAAEQLEQYRTIKAPTEEERAIIAGLVAATAGKPLVNLREAIVAGGCFDDGCPRLAAMVPNQAWCYVDRDVHGLVTFRGTPTTARQGLAFEIPGFDRMAHDELLAAHLIYWGGWYRPHSRRTQVPIVPPPHRVRGWKTRCIILWEVEEWAYHQPPRPPGDPMLLRHLVDDFYSVEATWDLTPLEQLVLGARR